MKTYNKILHDGSIETTHEFTAHTYTVSLDCKAYEYLDPAFKWKESEVGKWLMENAVEKPQWHTMKNPATHQEHWAVTVKLTDKNYVYYCLKYQ